MVIEKEQYFHYNNLRIELHKEVYEPAEDTFLLLNSLDVSSDDTVFEIGTGSGIIALSCAKTGASVVCSDINPYAIALVKKNFEQNKDKINGLIDIRKGSLFDVLTPQEQFSLIIFNPPYLPTLEDEYIGGNGWFDKAVSGGKNGLSITKTFLSGLPYHLKENGRAYTIFSTRSPRKEFNKNLKINGLKSSIVSTQSFTDESIEVHRITKL